MRVTVYTQPRGYRKDWVLNDYLREGTVKVKHTAQKGPDSNKEWPLVGEFQGTFLLLSPHNQLGDLHPEPGPLPGQAFRTALWRMVCDY